MKSTKILLFVSFLFATTFARSQDASLEDFGWLVGCWKGESEGRQFTENWMRPSIMGMQGISRTTKDGKMLNNEMLQIVKKDNAVYYIARPLLKKETSFKLIKIGFHQATFENPEHDFPQRIIYRLTGDDSLLARIEGINEGQQQAVDFPMKRVQCDLGAL